jgi:hypothetical protein
MAAGDLYWSFPENGTRSSGIHPGRRIASPADLGVSSRCSSTPGKSLRPPPGSGGCWLVLYPGWITEISRGLSECDTPRIATRKKVHASFRRNDRRGGLEQRWFDDLNTDARWRPVCGSLKAPQNDCLTIGTRLFAPKGRFTLAWGKRGSASATLRTENKRQHQSATLRFPSALTELLEKPGNSLA